MPMLPGHLPYCVTVAHGATCEISQFEYADIADAERMFREFAADPRTISCTLDDPDDVTLADYSRGAVRP